MMLHEHSYTFAKYAPRFIPAFRRKKRSHLEAIAIWHRYMLRRSSYYVITLHVVFSMIAGALLVTLGIAIFG